MAITGNQLNNPNTANSALAVIPVKMGFNSSRQRDPIARVERDMTALNPNIDNNGGSIYNLEEFCIVHRFETEKDEQRRTNEEHGYGSLTNTEVFFVMDYAFDSYQEDSWGFYDEPDYSSYFYNDSYFDMVVACEPYDLTGMCQMNPLGMGATLTPGLDGGLGTGLLGAPFTGFQTTDEMIANAAAGGEIAADGTAPATTAETSPEAEAGAEAKPDGASPDTAEPEQTASTPATPATPSSSEPAIESKINLTNQFSNVTTPKEESPDEPSVAPQPVAANNQSFQLRA